MFSRMSLQSRSCIAPDNCQCQSGWTGNNCAQGIQTFPLVALCSEIYMTRTSFTSYYSLLFVIFIWHHASQNCSRLGELGAWELFVYHAKGKNVISVIGHNLPSGLNLVQISKTLGRKWFFPCFSLPTAPSSPLSSSSSSPWLPRCVYPFSRFPFTFFLNFIFWWRD